MVYKNLLDLYKNRITTKNRTIRIWPSKTETFYKLSIAYNVNCTHYYALKSYYNGNCIQIMSPDTERDNHKVS